MVSDRRPREYRRDGRVRWRRVAALAATVLLAALSGCGASELATNAAPTAGALATTVATTIPPGIGATAAAGATTVANAAPGVQATAVALATQAAPTVNAAATAVAPTVVAGATQAAGSTGGPEATITGRPTSVDVNARTFAIRGTDGKDYEFTATTNSQVDFAQLATNLALQQQVTVTYRNTTSPYEVIGVR